MATLATIFAPPAPEYPPRHRPPAPGRRCQTDPVARWGVTANPSRAGSGRLSDLRPAQPHPPVARSYLALLQDLAIRYAAARKNISRNIGADVRVAPDHGAIGNLGILADGADTQAAI